ncbi:MAG: hypothetical protein VX801_00710 [Gemmatimonadota bacterium]|nr:hypothetical protein [Gemmatimonadota bacterium]
MKKTVRTAALTVLAAGVVGALAMLIIRSQISRHKRDLFSVRPFQRLAALAHINQEPASVDLIRLLRDFVAWEPRRMLRDRAQVIVDEMLADIREVAGDNGLEQA